MVKAADQGSVRTTVDPEEVAHFAAFADDWWSPRGKMRALHKFNPVRLAFIRDQACARFGRDPKALDSLKGLRILDVGCGGGILAEPLARLGATVVGIDPAGENIAAAHKHAEKGGLTINYRPATAETLAEAGERFDLVIASEVVEHVTDVGEFIRRCAEMVKPGGLMIVTTINRTLKSFGLVIVAAEYIMRWLPVGTHRWNKFVAPDELEAAMAAGGLAVIDRQGAIYDIFADDWRRSRDTDVNYMMAAERRA
jgi:2-polyprenyl-6-hydroxyphenyl methylase / 3-demethylubiquinone-9 3-methyltransferase